MEIKVLNTSFVPVGIIDTVESFIWKECYNTTGEFEIYNKYSKDLINLLKEDYYIQIPLSDRTMVIESTLIETNPESGDKLIIRGRSLESILDRRIILRQTIFNNTSFQNVIFGLLVNEVMNGVYPERNYPGFVFATSTDPLVTGLTVANAQYYGENLLDVITDLCQQVDLGYRLFLNSSNQFEFKLYAGANRSFGQSTNEYVVFSPDFDNLVDSKYYHTKRYKKNYVLVHGNAPQSSPGYPYRQQYWLSSVGTGMNRREMFEDATDIPLFVLDSSTEQDQTTYLNQLTQRGKEVLANNAEYTIFDGEIRVDFGEFVYNTDYFLGDIVQMKDNYGHTGYTRITEMTISENTNEKTMYPTLKTV